MAENIKKQIDALDKQERGLKVLREQFRSDCNHKKNGELNVVPSNDRRQGELKYICRKCRKLVNFALISEDEMDGGCDIVDRACDLIKVSLDPQKEEDAKVLKKIAKVQFRVRNEIKPLYAAAIKKNKSGGSRRRHNNEADGNWGKPQINGR